MTTATKSAPGRCSNTAEGQDRYTNQQEGVSAMTTISRECRYCTVPTDGGDVCRFCRDYTPPVPDGELARLGLFLDEFAGLVGRAATRIPGDAPLWSVIDATAAAAHVRAAARLLARAGQR